MKNMHQLIDLKLSALLSVFTVVSFSKADLIMKIIVFLLTVGYTLDRWYHLRKNKNDK